MIVKRCFGGSCGGIDPRSKHIQNTDLPIAHNIALEVKTKKTEYTTLRQINHSRLFQIEFNTQLSLSAPCTTTGPNARYAQHSSFPLILGDFHSPVWQGPIGTIDQLLLYTG